MASTRKVTMNYVGNTRNTIELRIEDETHTLGNLLSEELLEDKRCLFSAYRVEHPADTHVFLRLTADRDCQVRDLLLETLKRVEEETTSLMNQLKGF
ncbi:DNA-DIRECTED RNA POLYMERASE II [Encephalitozoon cuniculi GB-M1]|uniref:DNA-DIRECTED RNA POLYMERASE II n=2 Tax=Encephalitozoon cuniculi TaxID=6035 RepID=Q8SS03_ENCCU|nr:DNA-directed RNA polymerase II core subunit RPB11 [Encephalitozoon cuniculi GB-M1]AGE95496.1 DNA-directed RNA polymerase II [Encephalitozoon cuniculi]KMV66080.1 RNA polymerase II subunit Rpb11 [Encephalitozoon cuniculi EcunIII-L]UYI27815.1 DNA-directed RNA polymerase II subunit RPB11 [Encephalitozoon cuniculi]CAD26544.1 DNA-DIRECTED RNA POLYMERASE II [Encephalitozoon cuniculi GB-M1]